MNRLLLFCILIGPICIAGCKSQNEILVRSFLDARNNYDFERIEAVITSDYIETYISGDTLISDPEALKKGVGWAKVMDSKITLLELRVEEEKCITIEEFSNYMDQALGRQPRRFQITYEFQGNKIASSMMDTLPGYSKANRKDMLLVTEFARFCEEKGLARPFEMDQDSATVLRRSLEQYAKERRDR